MILAVFCINAPTVLKPTVPRFRKLHGGVLRRIEVWQLVLSNDNILADLRNSLHSPVRWSLAICRVKLPLLRFIVHFPERYWEPYEFRFCLNKLALRTFDFEVRCWSTVFGWLGRVPLVWQEVW